MFDPQNVRAIVLAALAAAASGVTAASEDYPRGRLSTDVQPLRYELTLNIDPRQMEFSGTSEIDLQIAKPTQRIWLHGLGLRVSGATLRTAGRTLPAKYTPVDMVSGVSKIDLPETVGAGPATLLISYAGTYRQGAEGLYRVVQGEDSYVFTQMEPIDARRAFPGFDDPQFKTPFVLTVISPAADRVVANTPLVASEPIGDGRVRHRFEPTLPLPTYLVALAVGPLDIVAGKPIPAGSAQRPPIPQRGVATRTQGTKLGYILDHTPDILLALEDYFGIPYPYQKLDQIASPGMAGAMENAGAITYSDSLLLMGADAPPTQLRGFYEVASHELAHQWFGDLVTPRWWDDIWLNEAFATWMGLKIANQLRPDLSPATSILDSALLAMESDAKSAGRPIRQSITDNTQIGSTFDSITYEKGGGVLSMMESYLGPETFRRGVRAHLQAHRHGTATADDFFAAMADAAGQPAVIEAFRSFVEQPGFPLLAIERESAQQLSIRQARYAPVGSKIAPGQTWKIPVCVNFYAAGSAKKSCTLMTGVDATLAIPRDIGSPVTIMPNADGAGYYRFALGRQDAAALLAMGDRLPDREALVLADSIEGGFHAGSVPLLTLIEATAALAKHPNRQVAILLGFELVEVIDRMLDGAQRAALRQTLGEIYAPRLATVGATFDATSNAADTAEVRLMRRSLLYLVGMGAREPQLRARMAEAAAQSLTDPQWLDPGLRDRVWAVGVQEKVPGLVDALAKTLVGEDALARGQAAFALGFAGGDPAAAARARKLLLDADVPASESFTILSFQLGQPETREQTWSWMQANFDAFSEKLPGFAKPFIFQMLSPFCDATSATQVKAFASGKAKALGTGELEVDRAVESIELCVALEAAHEPEFRQLLGN